MNDFQISPLSSNIRRYESGLYSLIQKSSTTFVSTSFLDYGVTSYDYFRYWYKSTPYLDNSRLIQFDTKVVDHVCIKSSTTFVSISFLDDRVTSYDYFRYWYKSHRRPLLYQFINHFRISHIWITATNFIVDTVWYKSDWYSWYKSRSALSYQIVNRFCISINRVTSYKFYCWYSLRQKWLINCDTKVVDHFCMESSTTFVWSRQPLLYQHLLSRNDVDTKVFDGLIQKWSTTFVSNCITHFCIKLH